MRADAAKGSATGAALLRPWIKGGCPTGQKAAATFADNRNGVAVSTGRGGVLLRELKSKNEEVFTGWH